MYHVNENTYECEGFESVKDVIVLRSAEQADVKPDFEKFNAQNRHVQTWHAQSAEHEHEFNTDVKGPWLDRWQSK